MDNIRSLGLTIGVAPNCVSLSTVSKFHIHFIILFFPFPPRHFGLFVSTKGNPGSRESNPGRPREEATLDLGADGGQTRRRVPGGRGRPGQEAQVEVCGRRRRQ